MQDGPKTPIGGSGPRSRRFELLDVFADRPLEGNPLPVVLEAQDLSGEDMMRLTRWLNQSETAFLLPPTNPEADYRVRIFTLERELPFAGHPTLGTCAAWLKGGGQPLREDRVVQECDIGLVALRRQPRQGSTNERSVEELAFAAPPLLRTGPLEADKAREVAEVLGIEPGDALAMEWADNGPGWVLVQLASADDVLVLEPAPSHPSRLEIGVVGAHPGGHECAYEVRTFFSDQAGVLREDPVTGSFQASAAQWLVDRGLATPPYIAGQGARIGRAGRVRVEQADGEIWIGGAVQPLVSGTLNL
jgi:PhzF family phenazine biosynthesis protein